MNHTIQYDGQTFADVFIGDPIEIRRPLRVEFDGNMGFAKTVGNLNFGGLQRSAGQQGFIFQSIGDLAYLSA